jgi:hypothetical protein
MLLSILSFKNIFDNYFKREKKNYFIPLFIVIGAVLIIVSFVSPYYFTNTKIGDPIIFSSTTGYTGDTLGGIMNPFIAIAGVAFTFLAFYMQKLANDDIKNQFKIQQFENQFFEMLRLHKENVNEMKITGYDSVIQETFDAEKKVIQIIRSHNTKILEGRKVFVSMVVELISCYEFLELINSTWKVKYEIEDLLKLSYRIFFFGSNSELIVSEKIDADFIEHVKEQLRKHRKRHRDSYSRKNVYEGLNKKINLFIKYSPFTGHENRLGHYYRHLYSTVKYVVNKEKEGLIDYKQSREYLKILRCQMSNDEQLMLYYNYIIGFGKDWENEGYLTKYRMLHNLPINKVKYTENPRVHFQEFINSIKSDEGELFEWGDVKQ